MSAEIVLLEHPDIRIEINPQVIVCEAIPDEAAEKSLARLGLMNFLEMGLMGFIATRPSRVETKIL